MDRRARPSLTVDAGRFERFGTRRKPDDPSDPPVANRPNAKAIGKLDIQAAGASSCPNGGHGYDVLTCVDQFLASILQALPSLVPLAKPATQPVVASVDAMPGQLAQRRATRRIPLHVRVI